jgi:hypothetical protein
VQFDRCIGHAGADLDCVGPRALDAFGEGRLRHRLKEIGWRHATWTCGPEDLAWRRCRTAAFRRDIGNDVAFRTVGKQVNRV